MPLNSTFNRVHMAEIKRFGPKRPVWCVTMHYPDAAFGAELFVIKAEPRTSTDANQKNMRFSYDAMESVGVGVKGRVLEPLEVKRFTGFEGPIDERNLPACPMKDLEENQVGEVAFTSLSGTWMIMEFAKAVKTLKKVAKAARGGDNDQATRLLASLSVPENLKRLGKILAVDLFMGQKDRFNFFDPSRPITNKGNVTFQSDSDGNFWFNGMDPFDPNGGSAKFDQDLARVKAYNSEDDYKHMIEMYKMLRDANSMFKVAEYALNSIVTELTNADPTLTKMFKVKRTAVLHVVEGMKEAKRLIKGLCDSRIAGDGGRTCPEGLSERVAQVKW